MSHNQTPYDAISQGPVSVPMETYGGQTQRIIAPPQPWCNRRRTTVIIAIVFLTLLYIAVVVVYAAGVAATARAASKHYSY